MKPELFERFEAFSDLDEQAKLIATKLLKLDVLASGECLFQVAQDDQEEYFLVEGKMEMRAADGMIKIIDAADPAARYPLALLRPRKFTAVIASKTATVIRVEIGVLQKLRKTIPVVGDAFSSFSPNQTLASTYDDDSEDQLHSIDKFIVGANQAIVDNRLMIANFDDVSSTIFSAINTVDVSVNTVVSAIQLDVAISAKIIKSANSAFFGGMQKVDSVRAAVVRLGLDLTIQLVTVMVVKEVFSSKNKSLQRAMQAIWHSAIQLACYAVVVGKRAKNNFLQGQTLLAGLMNDIGSLVIVAYLDQFPGMLLNISDQVLSSPKIKKQLGVALLKHWQFPNTLLEVIEKSDDYTRQQEHADICDVVCLARVMVRRTSYRKTPQLDIENMLAFRRLGFSTQEAGLVQDIMEEAGRYSRLFSDVS